MNERGSLEKECDSAKTADVVMRQKRDGDEVYIIHEGWCFQGVPQ
jgi:hypothetical protein